MKDRANVRGGTTNTLPKPEPAKVDRAALYEEREAEELWDDDLFLDSDLASLKKAQDIAEATHMALLQRCREDPNAFIEYVFTDAETGAPITQEWFHIELQNAFQDAARKYGLYILPRDHGKTTQVEGYALWRLGNDPNIRIKIVCASDAKAKERLFTIIQHLEHNPRLKEVFPDLRPADTGDWTKHKIVVQRDRIMRDASVEALGVTSTATGGRADLLLADDVVDRRNSLEQPKLRETIKTAWDADWINLLEPDGQVIYICTLWHTADLTHKLLSNPEYHVIRYDIPADFAPLWPGKWSTAALKKRRDVIGQREFDRGFRNIALSGDVVVVQPDWIEYWDSPPVLDDLVIFQAHDVSTGTGKDYFASVTLGIDMMARKVYVLMANHGLHTFLNQARTVMEQARAWLPLKVGIEATAYQVSLAQFIEDVSWLDIVPLKPRVSKWLRLAGITPYFERGQVVFNPALRPDNILNSLEHGDLVTELLQFPLGANDDLVDAFVHAFNLARDWALEEQMSQGISIGVSEIMPRPHPRPALPATQAELKEQAETSAMLDSLTAEVADLVIDSMADSLPFEARVIDLTKHL